MRWVLFACLLALTIAPVVQPEPVPHLVVPVIPARLDYLEFSQSPEVCGLLGLLAPEFTALTGLVLVCESPVLGPF